MRYGRGSTRPLACLPHSVDHFGRTIEAHVFEVASQVAPQAVSYGERILGDPALALTLFEETAANVSQTLANKRLFQGARIRAMRRYLFRAYLRRMSEARSTTPCYACATRAYLQQRPLNSEIQQIENQVMLREFLDSCDDITRSILQLRLEGRSWKQIEIHCGISANAANLRFSRALRQFCKSSNAARMPDSISGETTK